MVGDWKLNGHLLENERLLLQVEVRNSIWVNIVVEQQSACTPQSEGSWRTLLFDWFLGRNQQTAPDAKAGETLLLEFGSTLFLANVDVQGRPTVVEEADAAIIDALPTAEALFGGNQAVLLSIIPKSELRVQAVNGTFFLRQTRPVPYRGKTLVVKGPASAARALDDLREAVNLSAPVGPTASASEPPPAADRSRAALRRRRKDMWLPHPAWFRQLLSATKSFIDSETWHGGIKPDNIVVDSSEAIVLIDMARKYTTTSIASPEVMKGKKDSKPTDPEADAAKERGSLEVPADWHMEAKEKSEIYSIGRTIFFISEGFAMEDIYSNPKNPQASQTSFTDASSTPADLGDLILACVKDDPAQRPSFHASTARPTGNIHRQVINRTALRRRSSS
ncbi:hypothetical protein QQZ08_005105 [Neonectria magnoliae]|uniref:Protein kinase domain-containing protein n=1 Tax=Neonectria magnoliae TaxID=2732573 RepID=A0ABR1I481_9HYPO